MREKMRTGLFVAHTKAIDGTGLFRQGFLFVCSGYPGRLSVYVDCGLRSGNVRLLRTCHMPMVAACMNKMGESCLADKTLVGG